MLTGCGEDEITSMPLGGSDSRTAELNNRVSRINPRLTCERNWDQVRVET